MTPQMQARGAEAAVFPPPQLSWDTVRPSASWLVASQLREGGLYATLRSGTPLLAMALVWGIVTVLLDPGSLGTFLGLTITVRHLILALLVLVVWDVSVSWMPRLPGTPAAVLFQELRVSLVASAASGAVLLLPGCISSRYEIHVWVAVLLALALQMLTLALLGVTWLVYGHLAPQVAVSRRCLIVGSGPRAAELRKRLANAPGVYEIIGCIDTEYLGGDAERDRYLGPVSSLDYLLRAHPIDTVLIGLPVKSCYDEIQEVIRVAESVGVESHYLSDVFSTLVAERYVSRERDRHFTQLRVTSCDERRHIKRLLDIAGAATLLVLSMPLLLTACAAILLTDPGPLFFVQERYGKDRQRFRMYKLRTMVRNAEALQAALEHKNEVGGPVFKIRRDPRVTRIGALLRRTSIDELPQLLNVLRGEMSLVGPRPLPARDVARFEESWLLRRFSVKPGLTCLWQINGRSNTDFDFWIRQDLTYIDSWSLGLDLRILFRTVATVLRGSGAM